MYQVHFLPFFAYTKSAESLNHVLYLIKGTGQISSVNITMKCKINVERTLNSSAILAQHVLYTVCVASLDTMRKRSLNQYTTINDTIGQAIVKAHTGGSVQLSCIY